MRGPFLGLSYMVAYVACYGIQNEPSMTKPNFDGIGIAERQEEVTEYQKADNSYACCISPGSTFHQICLCRRPLSDCMQFCNEDVHCKGYVETSVENYCQIATISSCPSGCSQFNVGNVGELSFDGSCGRGYGGCFIKNTAETCEDGIQNQDETDIDCGGVCDACGEMFWVEKGCASSGSYFEGSFHFKSYEAGVRCCSKDENDENPCTTPLNCQAFGYPVNKMSYVDAVDECDEENRRLCSKDELLSEICCGTGGNCDAYEIWTSTGCQYVHLVNPNGHPAKTTCETLGYESIRQKEECYAAYKNIPDISGYTTHHSAIGCYDENPNHCFTNTGVKTVYFTRDDCPLHASATPSYIGLICKTCKVGYVVTGQGLSCSDEGLVYLDDISECQAAITDIQDEIPGASYKAAYSNTDNRPQGCYYNIYNSYVYWNTYNQYSDNWSNYPQEGDCDYCRSICKACPCQNGGTCTGVDANGDGKDDCDCTAVLGFEGTTCEDVTACPCQNGGTCTGVDANSDGKYDCDCTAVLGFEGTTCEDVTGPCNPDPCNQNGATNEVCDAGICNCGAAPCAAGQFCNAGVCEVEGPCNPDPCNQNEVCDSGICNCGAAPCVAGQICNDGVCLCGVNGERGNGESQGTCADEELCLENGSCTTCAESIPSTCSWTSRQWTCETLIGFCGMLWATHPDCGSTPGYVKDNCQRTCCMVHDMCTCSDW